MLRKQPICRRGCLSADGQPVLIRGHKCPYRNVASTVIGGPSTDISVAAPVQSMPGSAPTLSFPQPPSSMMNVPVPLISTPLATIAAELLPTTARIEYDFPDFFLPPNTTALPHDETIPEYPGPPIPDGVDAGFHLPMEFWNGLLGGLCSPSLDITSLPMNNHFLNDNQPEFGSTVLANRSFDIMVPLGGPTVGVPSMSAPLTDVPSILVLGAAVLMDVTPMDTAALLNNEAVENECPGRSSLPISSSTSLKRKCAADSTGRKRKLPQFATDSKRRTDAHSDRIKVLMESVMRLDCHTRPFIFLYVSRPESVLHPKGSSKSYISLNLRKVLDEAGRDSFVDDLHELVCASTRGQQITQEQMRRVNVNVTNALELRREVEARAAQLKALEAEINARADQVEARAAQLEKEMTLVHAMA